MLHVNTVKDGRLKEFVVEIPTNSPLSPLFYYNESVHYCQMIFKK